MFYLQSCILSTLFYFIAGNRLIALVFVTLDIL